MTKLSECLDKIKNLKETEDNKEADAVLEELGKYLYRALPDSLKGVSGYRYIRSSRFGFGNAKLLRYAYGIAELKIDLNGKFVLKYNCFPMTLGRLCMFLESFIRAVESDSYKMDEIEKIKEVLGILKRV